MNNYLTPDDVCRKLDEMFESHRLSTGSEPLYVWCVIKFTDNGSTIEDVIKLSSDAAEDDDDVFYFCNGIESLKGLTRRGTGEDFVVIDICSLS